jgi:hypothetical protein
MDLVLVHLFKQLVACLLNQSQPPETSGKNCGKNFRAQAAADIFRKNTLSAPLMAGVGSLQPAAAAVGDPFAASVSPAS